AGGAGRQVAEGVHDLHGDGRADGRARRGVRRLLQEDRESGGQGRHGEAGGGGAGQAGGGGGDGVRAGRVQVQVGERGHPADGADGGGAGGAEGAWAGGAEGHCGRARRQVVELVEDLHGHRRADGRARRGVRRLLQ